MFVLWEKTSFLLTSGGTRHVAGARSQILYLVPRKSPLTVTRKVTLRSPPVPWTNVWGRLLLFSALASLLSPQPQAPAGRWESHRPSTLSLGVCPQQGCDKFPAPTHSSWAGRPPCRRRYSAAPWCWHSSAEWALPPPDWHASCTCLVRGVGIGEAGLLLRMEEECGSSGHCPPIFLSRCLLQPQFSLCTLWVWHWVPASLVTLGKSFYLFASFSIPEKQG